MGMKKFIVGLLAGVAGALGFGGKGKQGALPAAPEAYNSHSYKPGRHAISTRGSRNQGCRSAVNGRWYSYFNIYLLYKQGMNIIAMRRAFPPHVVSTVLARYAGIKPARA